MRRSSVNERFRHLIGNAALVFGSILFSFLLLEGYLWIDDIWNRFGYRASAAAATPVSRVPPPTDNGADYQIPPEIKARAEARQRFTTMPQEWALRETSVPGATKAYYWQGALHVEDKNGFRRSTPFPPKDPGTFRVMVVGDSLTFGLGIEQKDTFTALLNNWMARDYRIEFLNLGVIRYQSEDVLRTIRTFLPKLQPNLVIYAVCQNDFAPSGKGEYHDDYLYLFPIPGRVKRFLIAHTRAGAFLNDEYDAALRKLHFRRDFYEDVLIGFGGYEKRFRQDVAEMNRTVTEAGLPPMVAMVVDQYPDHDSRGYQITQVAEDALKKGGADVIPTENYYRRYNRQSLNVSNWEGHPNEVANYIWAAMIMDHLREQPELASYKK